MRDRPFWLEKIEKAWRRRPIVWLAGVRRTGKTTLCKMLPNTIYLNCELPSVAERLRDPELFFGAQEERARIVLDEIHRLEDPSRILKIAADEFPHLRILATGSSTLAATRKFRDALTGRKEHLHLPPVLWTECRDHFGVRNIHDRLLRGGLPEPLLATEPDPGFYAEWLDSFYARDVQELFGIRERTGFLRLLEILLRQSGGLADYSALARAAGVSRPTVKSYLESMAIAYALTPIRPFAGGGKQEILRRPKIYGFDTGFVAFVHGWSGLRDDESGLLWEHLVLDALRSRLNEKVAYWRDKTGREIDFVVTRGKAVDVYECKLRPAAFDVGSLAVFRALYPRGENFIVSPGVRSAYKRSYGDFVVHVVGIEHLLENSSTNAA